MTLKNKDFISIKRCDVCRTKNQELIFKINKFPLTGIYSKKGVSLKKFDNQFLICKKCGHGQLKNQVDPIYLYQKQYAHRTSKSPLAVQMNNDFKKKLFNIIGNRKFNCVLEVGCNDLFLAKELKKHSKKVIGLEPIWGKEVKKIDNKVSVVGGFINDNLAVEKIKSCVKEKKIDLVVSSHTFEHVDNVRDSLEKVLKLVDDNCLFVIEVPSLDSIVRNQHYDQIFHQHLHYFCESPIKRLIQDLNCTFLNIDYNYQIWGGNVAFAFVKKKSKLKKTTNSYFNTNQIKQDYKSFRERCKKIIDYLKNQKKPIVAFGAAQMLPILAYHSKSNFSFCSYLFDDNKNIHNRYLPLVKLKIQKPIESILKSSFVLIAANEMVRQIFNRLQKVNPLRIITWHNDF